MDGRALCNVGMGVDVGVGMYMRIYVPIRVSGLY